MILERTMNYAITALENGDFIIRRFDFRYCRGLTYYRCTKQKYLFVYKLRKPSKLYFKSVRDNQYKFLNLL